MYMPMQRFAKKIKYEIYYFEYELLWAIEHPKIEGE